MIFGYLLFFEHSYTNILCLIVEVKLMLKLIHTNINTCKKMLLRNLIVPLQMATRRQENLVDLKQKENSNKCSC